MNDSWRFVMFLSIVLGIWTSAHVYVGWRLATLPLFESTGGRRLLILGMALLWPCYLLGRLLSRRAHLPRPGGE